MVEPGAVIEAAHRLKPLAEADHGGGAEGHDPLYHTHSGNDGVSVGAGGPVEADGGHAGQTLPGQGGQSALNDHQIVAALELDPGDVDVEVATPGAAHQQQAEADELAEDGGPGGPGDAHVKYEDQQRVQPDVQHRTADDAHHTVHGAALKTQLIVEDQRGGHPGSTQKDHPHIVPGIGQNGGGGAQEIGQRCQKDLTQDADEETCGQSGEKAGSGHVGGLLRMVFAQFPGDKVAAAVAKKEPNGLDNGHQGEHHTHGTGGWVAFQHANEKSVRHVVKGSHQHTDDAGQGQPADQATDRVLRQMVKFLFLQVLHGSSPPFLKLRNLNEIITCLWKKEKPSRKRKGRLRSFCRFSSGAGQRRSA